jgi:hypothetical protein
MKKVAPQPAALESREPNPDIPAEIPANWNFEEFYRITRTSKK